MKPLISLKPFLHRSGEQIGIYFKHAVWQKLADVILHLFSLRYSSFYGLDVIYSATE